MNKLLGLGIVVAGGVFLASCASFRSNEQPLVVSVSRDGETCRLVVSGERVSSDRLVEIARPQWRRRAVMIYDKDTPYRCIGATVSALQRAGLAKIDAVIWDGTDGR